MENKTNNQAINTLGYVLSGFQFLFIVFVFLFHDGILGIIGAGFFVFVNFVFLLILGIALLFKQEKTVGYTCISAGVVSIFFYLLLVKL